MSTGPRKKQSKFTLNRNDGQMEELVKETDQKVLAAWAIDCAERVLPYFEAGFPDDFRPRDALVTLGIWITTGVFSMPIIRTASLASHAAARDVGDDTPARQPVLQARPWQQPMSPRMRWVLHSMLSRQSGEPQTRWRPMLPW